MSLVFFYTSGFPIHLQTLREKCRYSKLFFSAFSRIWTEYGENNSEYGHFYAVSGFLMFSGGIESDQWYEMIQLV